MCLRPRPSAQPQPPADGECLVDEELPQKILDRIDLFAQENASNLSLLRHPMAGAKDCIRMRAFAVLHKIFIGLHSAVDPLLSSRDVAVVMILMHYGRILCQIDNRQTILARVLDAPLIEPHAADCQRRNLFIRALPKDKAIDARVALQLPFAAQTRFEFFLPAVAEVQRFPNFQIRAAPNRKELRKSLLDFFDPSGEFSRKNNIRINIREQIVARSPFGIREDIREKWCAMPVAGYNRYMNQAELRGALGGAFFLAKEDDLGSRLQFRPTRDRVALDGSNVPVERLRHRQNRDGSRAAHHWLLVTRTSCRAFTGFFSSPYHCRITQFFPSSTIVGGQSEPGSRYNALIASRCHNPRTFGIFFIVALIRLINLMDVRPGADSSSCSTISSHA